MVVIVIIAAKDTSGIPPSRYPTEKLANRATAIQWVLQGKYATKPAVNVLAKMASQDLHAIAVREDTNKVVPT